MANITPLKAKIVSSALAFHELESGDTVDPIFIISDVLAVANLAGFPGTGKTNTLYIANDTNYLYRWSGSAYVQVGGSSGGGAGKLVNRTYAEYTGYAAMSTVIPTDNTIPQITEGTQVVSATITPASASNILRARFTCWLATSNAASVTAALFNGATNAIAAVVNDPYATAARMMLTLEYEYVAGTTSPVTLSIRAGSGTGIIYINGSTTQRFMGGVSRATLVVEELTP